MSETLSWNFVGNDRLTDVLDKLSVTLGSVDRKLSGLGKTSTKVKGETEGLETEVKQLGEQTEKTGDKVKRAFRGIDEEIAATALELKVLQREFASTGDVDLLKKISDKKSYKSKLDNIAKDLGGDAEKAITGAIGSAVKADEGFVEKIAGVLPDALTNPYALAAIGVAAATLGTLIVSAIGGAITAAAGIGIAGAGVMGAIMGDPAKFAAAWSTQLGSIKDMFIDASKPFAGPTLDAIKTIGPLIASWHIDTMFAKAATYVGPLVAGLEGFATYVEAGVDSLVQNAGPVISMLSTVLPEVGQDIQIAFEAIGQNAQGGADALGDMLRLAGGLIGALGIIIGQSEAMYHEFHQANTGFDMFLHEHETSLRLLTFGMSDLARAAEDGFNGDRVAHFGKELDGVPSTMDHIGESADEARAKLKKFSDQFDEFLGKNLDAQHAAIAYEKALDDLAVSIQKNGHSLNVHTEAGRHNREAILAIVEAAEKQREATIAETNNVPAATAAYMQQIEALRANLKQMGYNTAQIDELTAAALRVPSTIPIDVELRGAKAAGAALGNLITMAGGIGKLGAKVAGHRALGGAVMPGGVYQVNEHGVETFQPNVPGRIVSAGQGGGNGDVLGVLVVKHVGQNGEEIRTELLQLKRQRGLTSLGLN